MKTLNKKISFFFGIVFICFFQIRIFSQVIPDILSKPKVYKENYLPDFSYAGYHFGEQEIPTLYDNIIEATDYGVIANDGLDDSKALLKALEATKKIKGPVILQLPKGRVILSAILYIERSNFIFRGTGTGKEGTEIYCPIPMMYMEDPEMLKELREYLLYFDKRQREPENNIDLPFSQYAWSGGMLWTRIPGERVKGYLGSYDVPEKILAKVIHGNRGKHILKVADSKALNIGDVLELRWYNKEGSESGIIKELYQQADVKVGSHHWKFPTLPIVRQQVKITAISGNKVTIKAPLTIDIKPAYNAQLVVWNHLEEVGIEHLRITFPKAPYIAHHVERGYNAIFLTRIFNSWVRNVVIDNADSGILTEEIANVTISDIVTEGTNKAHYTVTMGGVHNVLVRDLKIYNDAVHPLSFNTFATKNVYKNCEVFVNPILDQHSGANHQNLFDNISVYLNASKNNSYPLFGGGGAEYWKPSHGAFSTFWNIKINMLSGLDRGEAITLNGMKDGPYVRIIGVSGNRPLNIEYDPKAYIEHTNTVMHEIPSLYDYQLKQRIR